MTPQKSCFLRVFKWKKRENSVLTNGIDVQKLQERSRRFPVKSNTSQCHCITAISQALRLHTPAHTNLLNTFNVPHYTDCDGQALVPLTTKFCSPPQWEQTHGITRTLHDFRLVGAGCSEVTEFTVKWANVKRCILEQSHVRHTIWCKVTKTYCQWLGDRLFGKRLMEFLAALKKNLLCHSASPSETVSGLSSLFGAELQHHGAPAATPPWLPSPAHLPWDVSPCSTSQDLNAAPKVAQGECLQKFILFGPAESYSLWELPTVAKRELRKKQMQV